MAGSDNEGMERPARAPRKGPRDPVSLRAKLREANSKLRVGAAAKGDARPAARLGQTSRGKKPIHASVAKRGEPPDHVLDDRALHDAWSAIDTNLEGTSGRTGQVRDYSPEQQLSVEIERFPEPEAKLRPPAPSGPACHLIREVLAALDRDLVRRRSYRANRDEQEGPSTLADGDREQQPGRGLIPDPLRERGRQLRKRYIREETPSIESENVDPLEFAVWLRSLRPFVEASSWRLYRVAGLAEIQTRPHGNLEAAVTMLTEDGRRRAVRAKKVDQRRLAKEDGISQTRADRITYSDYQKLLRKLPIVSRADAVNWLRDWLVAGVSTGVAPAEWPLADLEEQQLDKDKRKIWLHVVNPGQRQDSRSLTYRTLDISKYQPDTAKAIERMVQNSRRWAIEGKIQQRRSECTQLLEEASDVLFREHKVKFSLFTFRHQFIANMKTIMDRAEVIAMAGETEIEEQSKHYTKRRAAWDRSEIKDVPAPSEKHVKQIKSYLGLVKVRETVMRAMARRRQEEDDDEF
jgi:hypothetical protein